MRSEVITSRYAEALLSAAMDQKEAETVLEQIEWYQENAASEITPLLENPMIPKEKKEALITKLFWGNAGKLLLHFILLLLRKGRIGYWGDICRLYPQKYDEKLGVVKGTLSLAYPLSDDLIVRLKGKIESKIGRRVNFQLIDDPKILGGFIFTTGTERIDASVKTQLTHIETHLKKVSVG